MSFDSWLAHDPKQDDKMCERCEEQAGTTLYNSDWVCEKCEYYLEEEACLCGLCACGQDRSKHSHLCDYCENAHPEYHKDDCDYCGEEE